MILVLEKNRDEISKIFLSPWWFFLDAPATAECSVVTSLDLGIHWWWLLSPGLGLNGCFTVSFTKFHDFGSRKESQRNFKNFSKSLVTFFFCRVVRCDPWIKSPRIISLTQNVFIKLDKSSKIQRCGTTWIRPLYRNRNKIHVVPERWFTCLLF